MDASDASDASGVQEGRNDRNLNQSINETATLGEKGIHSNEFVSETNSRENIFAYGLFLVMGFTPWLLVDGLFLQLPIFVSDAPERSAIASYMGILVQTGNIFAFLYALSQSYFTVKYKYSVSFLLLLAVTDAILLCFIWDWKGDLFGSQHSFGILACTLIAGIVGCLSVVIFFPFASQYKSMLTSGLATGMGFNSIIASIVAVIQSPGNNPRFGVSGFFAIMAIVATASLTAFLLILNTSVANKFKERNQITLQPKAKEKELLITKGQEKPIATVQTLTILRITISPILNQFVNCVMNYTLLTALPYTVDGYSRAEELLQWLIITGMISGAVGRFSTTFVQLYLLTAVNVMQGVLWIYLFSLSLLGSSRPEYMQSHETTFGSILILAYGIFSLLNGYENTTIFKSVQSKMDDDKEKNSLIVEKASRLVGLSNQFGAFSGTLLSFILVVAGVLS